MKALHAYKLHRAVLVAFCIFGVLFLILPLMVIIGASFTETQYLAFPPQGFTLEWYGEFVKSREYMMSMGLSALLALGSTLTSIFLGLPVALALSRTQTKLNGAVAGLFLSPLVLPTIIIGVALLQFAYQFGFARSWLALYIGHTILVIPYVVRTGLASLSGFQLSLEEASQDLGSSKLQTFFLITLPIIKPGVIAGSLFGLIISWVNVELSIFNSTASLMPLPVRLFNYIQYSVDPMIAAVSAFTIYIAVAIVFFIDRLVGIDKINSG